MLCNGDATVGSYYALCGHRTTDASPAYPPINLPFESPELGISGLGIYMQTHPSGDVLMQVVRGTAAEGVVIDPYRVSIADRTVKQVAYPIEGDYHALIEGAPSFYDAETETSWLQVQKALPKQCLLPEPTLGVRFKKKGQHTYDASSAEDCCGVCSDALFQGIECVHRIEARSEARCERVARLTA